MAVEDDVKDALQFVGQRLGIVQHPRQPQISGIGEGRWPHASGDDSPEHLGDGNRRLSDATGGAVDEDRLPGFQLATVDERASSGHAYGGQSGGGKGQRGWFLDHQIRGGDRSFSKRARRHHRYLRMQAYFRSPFAIARLSYKRLVIMFMSCISGYASSRNRRYEPGPRCLSKSGIYPGVAVHAASDCGEHSQ